MKKEMVERAALVSAALKEQYDALNAQIEMYEDFIRANGLAFYVDETRLLVPGQGEVLDLTFHHGHFFVGKKDNVVKPQPLSNTRVAIRLASVALLEEMCERAVCNAEATVVQNLKLLNVQGKV